MRYEVLKKIQELLFLILKIFELFHAFEMTVARSQFHHRLIMSMDQVKSLM